MSGRRGGTQRMKPACHGMLPWMLAGCVALAACDGKTAEPAEAVRALIDAAGTAAEQRDYATLESLLAERYTDDQGYDRKDASRLMRLILMRNRSLHILHVVRDLHVLDPETVTATVLVAVAARPVDKVEQLFELRAELLRFELRFILVDGSSWRVDEAAWRRASATEFL